MYLCEIISQLFSCELDVNYVCMFSTGLNFSAQNAFRLKPGICLD
jgi:hypothetical protein